MEIFSFMTTRPKKIAVLSTSVHTQIHPVAFFYIFSMVRARDGKLIIIKDKYSKVQYNYRRVQLLTHNTLPPRS